MISLIPVTDRFDIDGFMAVFDDPDVCYYTASFTYPYTREKAEARYQQFLERAESHPFVTEYLIWQGDRVVGTIGLFINETDGLEVGYAVHPHHHGQGIASAALEQVIDLLKLAGYHGILEAGYAKDNEASGKVLQKQGFEACGESSFYSKQAAKDLPCIRVQRVL